jgi:hypothetical protein
MTTEQQSPPLHLPPSMQWLDAEGIAQMIGGKTTARQVRERIVCRPDFPTALRIDGVGRNGQGMSNPRWRADEVARWLNAERERNAPRERARAA